MRELSRFVGNDCAVEVDTNSYSVPWRLIGERVAVTVAAGEVRIRHGVREVAVHSQVDGRRQRVIDRAHLDGVAGVVLRGRPTAEIAPAVNIHRRLRCCVRLPNTKRRSEGASDATRKKAPRCTDRPLDAMLTRLKLSGIRDQLDSLLDEAARSNLSARETLILLCEREIARKDHRRIEMALKLAHFPAVKELASFDFEAQPSIDPKQIRDLAASRWIANGENVLLLGPPGVGKTHLADRARARGDPGRLHACSSRRRRRWSLASPRRTASSGSTKSCSALSKPKLLIVDELGYLPLEPDAAHLFFQLVSRRYETGAMLITSNRSSPNGARCSPIRWSQPRSSTGCCTTATC